MADLREQLLPCPCGLSASMSVADSAGRRIIHCVDNDCHFSISGMCSSDELVRRWNRRALAAQPAPAGEVALPEALCHAGARLANCAYNLAQRSHLTDDERRSLDESRTAWDAAIRDARAAAAAAAAAAAVAAVTRVPVTTPNSCDGCQHLCTERWNYCLDNVAKCMHSVPAKVISVYWHAHHAVPQWCPLAAAPQPEAQAGRVPGGFVLAPVEPDAAMMKAGRDHDDLADAVNAKRIYRAMIAAAPQPIKSYEEAKAGAGDLIVIGDTITVRDLTQKLALKGGDVVKALFKMGIMATITQTIDHGTAAVVAEHFGRKVAKPKPAEDEPEAPAGADDIYAAYPTWPIDLRAKLSLHDLRRMSGWAPRPNPAGWAIDMSAGRPILVLNGCSVIEAEDARYVLSLIRADQQPKPAEGGAVDAPAFDAGELNDYGGGYVEWWHDYICRLLNDADEHYRQYIAPAGGGAVDEGFARGYLSANAAMMLVFRKARRVVAHLGDGSCDTSKMPEGMGSDLRELRAALDRGNLGYASAPAGSGEAVGEVGAGRAQLSRVGTDVRPHGKALGRGHGAREDRSAMGDDGP